LALSLLRQLVSEYSITLSSDAVDQIFSLVGYNSICNSDSVNLIRAVLNASIQKKNNRSSTAVHPIMVHIVSKLKLLFSVFDVKEKDQKNDVEEDARHFTLNSNQTIDILRVLLVLSPCGDPTEIGARVAIVGTEGGAGSSTSNSNSGSGATSSGSTTTAYSTIDSPVNTNKIGRCNSGDVQPLSLPPGDISYDGSSVNSSRSGIGKSMLRQVSVGLDHQRSRSTGGSGENSDTGDSDSDMSDDGGRQVHQHLFNQIRTPTSSFEDETRRRVIMSLWHDAGTVIKTTPAIPSTSKTPAKDAFAELSMHHGNIWKVPLGCFVSIPSSFLVRDVWNLLFQELDQNEEKIFQQLIHIGVTKEIANEADIASLLSIFQLNEATKRNAVLLRK
jgi:hypothetical protein